MSLKKKAFSGTLWTSASSVFLAVIQIFRLSILTRFLDKSDFGLVAIIVLVLGFTHIFADLGVSVSLFSKQHVTKKEYSSLYWVNLGLGILIYLVLSATAPLVASFYHLPQLSLLIPLMGLDLIITTAGRQFRVFLQKQLRFRKLAMIDIFSALLSLGLAIWIAAKGGGVYSLILSTLAASLMATLLLIVTGLKTHPMVFYINIKEGKEFYRIGIFQIGSEILDYISSQLDILIVGKIMSTSELGTYNLVKQLVLRLYNIITPIVTGVAVPVLATLNEDPEQLREKYLKMVRIVAFVNIPVYALMAILAKEALSILYGPSYVSSYFYFQVLCCWGAVVAVVSAASSIIVIRGRTDLGFRWTIFRILTNPLFVIIGSFWGFKGIVIGQASCALFYFAFYWLFLIKKVLNNVSFVMYSSTSLYYLLISALLFFVIYAAKVNFLDSLDMIWVNIALVVPVFAGLYALLNKKTIRDVYEFVVAKKI